jgi:hypothetical protein
MLAEHSPQLLRKQIPKNGRPGAVERLRNTIAYESRQEYTVHERTTDWSKPKPCTPKRA